MSNYQIPFVLGALVVVVIAFVFGISASKPPASQYPSGKCVTESGVQICDLSYNVISQSGNARTIKIQGNEIVCQDLLTGTNSDIGSDTANISTDPQFCATDFGAIYIDPTIAVTKHYGDIQISNGSYIVPPQFGSDNKCIWTYAGGSGDIPYIEMSNQVGPDSSFYDVRAFCQDGTNQVDIFSATATAPTAASGVPQGLMPPTLAAAQAAMPAGLVPPTGAAAIAAMPPGLAPPVSDAELSSICQADGDESLRRVMQFDSNALDLAESHDKTNYSPTDHICYIIVVSVSTYTPYSVDQPSAVATGALYAAALLPDGGIQYATPTKDNNIADDPSVALIDSPDGYEMAGCTVQAFSYPNTQTTAQCSDWQFTQTGAGTGNYSPQVAASAASISLPDFQQMITEYVPEETFTPQ